MLVQTVLAHRHLHAHTCTHTTPWTALCVILGCGRPWLESGSIVLCWIHWDHMFKTAWRGLQLLPYKARPCCVYIPGGWERARRRKGDNQGWMALALETGQFIFCVLTDFNSLPGFKIKKEQDQTGPWKLKYSHLRARIAVYPKMSKQNSTEFDIPL